MLTGVLLQCDRGDGRHRLLRGRARRERAAWRCFQVVDDAAVFGIANW